MKLPINQISIGPRQRLTLNEQHVLDLMESFKDCGQVQAITVHKNPAMKHYVLIAGRHRLEAATRLGWTHILASISDAEDDITRQKQELVEDTRRLNRTWQEECLAISKLHYLLTNERALEGQTWTNKMMIAFTGYPAMKVIYGLRIAELLRATNPKDEQIWDCDSFEQALQTLLGRVDMEAVQEIERRKQALAHPTIGVIPPGTEIETSGEMVFLTDMGVETLGKDMSHIPTEARVVAPVRVKLQCNIPDNEFPVFLIIAYKPDYGDSLSEWIFETCFDLRSDQPSYLVVFGVHLSEFDDWKTAAIRSDLKTMPFPLVWNRQSGVATLWPFLYDNQFGLVFQRLPKDYNESLPTTPYPSLIQSFPCDPDDHLPAQVISHLCNALCPIGQPVLFPCNASPVECAMAGYTPVWYEQDEQRATQQKKELTEWYKNNVPGCEVVQ